MKHELTRGAICAALALAGTGAFAASDVTQPWYGGLDVSRSRLDKNNIPGATSVDKSDSAFGLNFGYRFTPNFALEGGYANLGKFSVTTGAGTGNYKAQAWSLAPVGIWPLDDKWSLYGKLGLTRAHSELGGLGGSERNTGWLAGIGTTYDFTKGLFGKIGWDRYEKVGDNGTTGRNTIDTVGVGVGFRF